MLAIRHAGTPCGAISKLMKFSRLDLADLAIVSIVLGIECACAGVVVALFALWLMSLNSNRLADCTGLGRGANHCAPTDDASRRLVAERKPAPDCPNLGKGGRVCSPLQN